MVREDLKFTENPVQVFNQKTGDTTLFDTVEEAIEYVIEKKPGLIFRLAPSVQLYDKSKKGLYAESHSYAPQEWLSWTPPEVIYVITEQSPVKC